MNTDPIVVNILSDDDVEHKEVSWAETASLRALAVTGNDSSDLGTLQTLSVRAGVEHAEATANLALSTWSFYCVTSRKLRIVGGIEENPLKFYIDFNENLISLGDAT